MEISYSRVVDVRCVERTPACDAHVGEAVPHSNFYFRPFVRDTTLNSISMSETKYSRYLSLVQGILGTEHSKCGGSSEKLSCTVRGYIGERTQEFQGQCLISWLWVGAELRQNQRCSVSIPYPLKALTLSESHYQRTS